MDYQGNYFPEEHDERESKVYKNVKRIFKWTIYGISFLVYAVIFTLIIVNRDSDILETNYMAELPQFENVDTEDIELYRINSAVFMDEFGSLQIFNIDYSDEYGIIEIGVKFNAKKLTDGNYTDAVEYALSDSEGNIYEMVHSVEDKGGRYGFERVCFSGLNIDLESNDLKYDEEKPDAPRTNVTYNLAVYRKSDGELLYDFVIYNNSTVIYKTEYEEE